MRRRSSFLLQSAKGFTLIELLVVISIIGLLATFAVVRLAGSRDKARIAKGASFASQMRGLYGGQGVGRWRMETGSGTTIIDESGNGFNGTLPAGTFWTDGPVGGKAITADGSHYATLPTISSRTDLVGGTSGKMLFMAWVRPTSVPAPHQMIATGFPGFAYCEVANNPTVIFRCIVGRGSGVNLGVGSSSEIPLGTWTHVAILLEAGVGAKIYIDGKLDNTISNTDIIIKNFGTTSFIGRYTDLSYNFFGDLDDIEAYYASTE